jgi:hypothetical protein
MATTPPKPYALFFFNGTEFERVLNSECETADAAGWLLSDRVANGESFPGEFVEEIDEIRVGACESRDVGRDFDAEIN